MHQYFTLIYQINILNSISQSLAIPCINFPLMSQALNVLANLKEQVEELWKNKFPEVHSAQVCEI